MHIETLSDEGLLTGEEINQLLKCSDSTRYRLVEQGKLEAIKLGSATRFTARSAKRLIENAPRLVVRRHNRKAAA